MSDGQELWPRPRIMEKRRAQGKPMTRMSEDEGRRAGPWPHFERAQLVAAAEALMAANPVVDAVYLFGSRARGQIHPGSDVDVAVLAEPPVPVSQRISTQSELARFLEDR